MSVGPELGLTSAESSTLSIVIVFSQRQLVVDALFGLVQPAPGNCPPFRLKRAAKLHTRLHLLQLSQAAPEECCSAAGCRAAPCGRGAAGWPRAHPPPPRRGGPLMRTFCLRVQGLLFALSPLLCSELRRRGLLPLVLRRLLRAFCRFLLTFPFPPPFRAACSLALPRLLRCDSCPLLRALDR